MSKHIEDMSSYLLCAANSISSLRACDVYRVLVESNDKLVQPRIAHYIKHHRPDLAGEVDAVLAESN